MIAYKTTLPTPELNIVYAGNTESLKESLRETNLFYEQSTTPFSLIINDQQLMSITLEGWTKTQTLWAIIMNLTTTECVSINHGRWDVQILKGAL